MIIVASLLALCAAACCALSMEVHWRQVFSRGLSRSRQVLLRVGAMVLSVACVLACTTFLTLPLAFPLAAMLLMLAAVATGLILSISSL